ncbi:hypothetical protein [Neptunicoccus cionae]|uniref:Uncharacterized protein n=1 Tax=Neptunicoccus cionae TaxID=2035344 RepID=A0A916VQJ6_9RHOB|nr:hypothetical protein [Amylibacter cionae]GGA18441.1 hypothetical protein GCM10011498_18900 [Amylibacter cionae]
MAKKFLLNKKHIVGGKYIGLMRARGKGNPTPALEMLHLGTVVGSVTVEPVGSDGDNWEVAATIPTELLTDGVQTFLLVVEGDTEILDRFSIITGEPLEEDLRAEIELLRAELDMLKRAFRRHCTETMG